MDKEAWQAAGEVARLKLGIDGTMGDAQDVKHPFQETALGPVCLACGLSAAARVHH